MDPATRSLATVTSFDFTHGANSYAGLIADAQGNFYGTTRTGGPDSVGTVFELPAGAGAVTTLATFAGPNGGNPQSPLVADAGGNLYGTASFGGLGNHGTVFEVSAGTHQLSTLVAFNGTNGDYPLSGVIADSKGNLYGSTRGGAPAAPASSTRSRRAPMRSPSSRPSMAPTDPFRSNGCLPTPTATFTGPRSAAGR